MNSFGNSGSNSNQKDFTTSQVTKSGNTGTVGGPRENQIQPAGYLEIHAPVVTYEDMKVDMKEFAFEICEQAFKLLYKGEKKYFKDMAEFIKLEFDKKFKPSWHVIVETLDHLQHMSKSQQYYFGQITQDFQYSNTVKNNPINDDSLRSTIQALGNYSA